MEYKIETGTVFKLKQGFMKGSFSLMYCGMPSKDTFVLTPLISSGYSGFSPSIYYSKDTSQLVVYDWEFDLIEVTPDYIILQG
jgi:hypothetical protein